MAETTPAQATDGIAVVGIAGRFPGSRNVEEFWENLVAGREGLTFFTVEELEEAGCDLGANKGKRTRSRGVVEDADYFDAAFFGYTPREAEIMDPQQRVFLEVAWSALENAGFDPERVPGAVGVYAGASINTYYPHNVMSRPDVLRPFGVFPAVTLNEKDFLATRVAYKLNLRGPAITVQTACSTSLVAICNACQSLFSYECDIALAGGVAINYPHCHSYIHEEGGMISEDGHCKPFDKDATGTLFSDGAGAVALRRLEDAVASGDTILAVIKGYALNNDGSDKAGFTAPSINGQSEVIQMAQAFANIEPDSISYVEAHGTATPLGDPIEIAGLTRAFRTGTEKTQYCALGSVKSNIGHLDVAAGIAGFIKTVLALRHRQIPPMIHFTEPNSKIDFASTPFYVTEKLEEWTPPEGVPRRAGVSSFGIGGTNAHVVLEEAPDHPVSGESRAHQLLLISARSKEAAQSATGRLAHHLARNTGQALADVAFTLQTGRYQFNQRRVVVCRDRSEAQYKLSSDKVAELPTLLPARHNPPVAFMFPGQGAQRVNMGLELHESEALYRKIVDQCAEILSSELALDLRTVLFPPAGKEAWAEQQIVQTRITQPALFVTEYALARLWMSWGISPSAMIGHSVGEYVAACLADVFSLEDGLRLIAERGRLIQEQPTGSMLAVMAGEGAVRPLLVDGVSIATINAPALCVVSGSHDDIDSMQAALAEAKMECRPLHTSHAFHSAMMEPVVDPFTKMLSGMELRRPKLPFVSNLTAQWITDDEAIDPSYWAQHLRQAVRFADGANELLARADQQVLVEVGPGATLTSLTRMHPAKKPTHVIVPSLASATPDQQSELATVLATLGRLWQAGLDIDWAGFYTNEKRRRVPLPTYPFEHKRFFIEPGQTQAATPVADTQEDGPEPDEEESSKDAAVAPPMAPRDQIVAKLRAGLEALSGLSAEELNANARLLEMGFDSLLLSRVCSAIDVEFDVALTPRQIAEELPSISALADHIAAQSIELPARSTDMERAQRSVSPAGVDITIPVTDAQREVWLASQLNEDLSRTYNEARIVRITGPLRPDVLHESLQTIVDRNDALRSRFSPDGSTQTIASHMAVQLGHESVPELSDTDGVRGDLAARIDAAIGQSFDLSAGPLYRFTLFEHGNIESLLLMIIHHTVADGWSWALILDELGDIYSARMAGQTSSNENRPSFADYVSWTQSDSWVKDAEAAERYWLEALADRPEEIELPSDRPRPAEKTFRSGRVVKAFDPALAPRELKETASRLDCTVFHLLTASFFAWLHRLTGRDDLVVAVPTAGQVASANIRLGNADRLVGHCVNMLPIRLRCQSDMPFDEFLQASKRQLLDARDHQNVSFQNLVNRLGWPRDPSRIPIASVSLNFAYDHQVQLADLETQTELPAKAFNFFDLTIDMISGDHSLSVDCKFNEDLFDAETVERWLGQWELALLDSVTCPDRAVGDQNMLSDAEKERLLHGWNETSNDYPVDSCLHQLFERQARLTPDRTAVTSNGISWTYAQLDCRANRIARLLRDRGAGRNDRVGICVERDNDMLAAVLGILKTGAAYVPLDPTFPRDRLRFMAEDAQLAMLLSTTTLADAFELTRERQLLLDADAELIDEQSDRALEADNKRDARSQDPAYVIYTSGSTGTPKGVVVPHRAVVNFLASMARKPGLGEADVLLAVTTLSFDISVLELYLPLTVGAQVVIARRDESLDGSALIGMLQAHGVTIMQATPVTWRLLLEAEWTGGMHFKALVGGESLPRDLAEALIALGIELWNMYGPTETTVWSTCARIADARYGISIGTPIDNTAVYILDDRKNLCPIGVPGELYIGGDGVALGYWNRDELTADRFIKDPFGQSASGKIYGTGDKARWLPDGTIEHLGRFDDQVKVRGYRVELGEIEARIAEHDLVQAAAARLWTVSTDDVRIVACYVAGKSRRVGAAQLRKHLRARLPEYMIPQYFLPVDELPLTPNGKIDRRRLPTPAAAESPIAAHEPPANPIEQTIAEIWTTLIQPARPVSRHDMFFEIGGHSLLALRAIQKLEKQFGKTLDFRALFQESLTQLSRRFDVENADSKSTISASP